MNEVTTFDHPMFGTLRTVMHEGKPMFVGVDVARALEYAYPSQAIGNHCKGIVKLTIPSRNQHGTEVIQRTNCIPEGDVYRLVTKAAEQSRSPGIREKAERFERWVYDEVLPGIRTHGAYLTDARVEQILSDPDTLIRLATDLKAERAQRKALEATTAQQERLIGELQPKARYCDLILQNSNLVEVSVISKDYGMSAQAFNDLLHRLGVQYKVGRCWVLYQRYALFGYTQSKTDMSSGKSYTFMCWTQTGRLFLYELLKQHDVLPLIERNTHGFPGMMKEGYYNG